jgi:uncharacterized protein YhbP (UPF0306 family)
MQVSVSDEVREYIITHDTLTLATTFRGKVWTTPLFYQVDSDLRLYFISDAGTRHIQNAMRNPDVALSIIEQSQAWHSIRGIQLEGTLSRISDENRDYIEQLYCEKFTFLRNILEAVDDEKSERVKQRFQASDFYVVTPGFIRFIDNARGFGFKEEYYLSLI